MPYSVRFSCLFSAVLAVLFSDITLNRNAAFAAGLSSGAQSTLSGMQRENLPFLSGLPTDLKSKFDGSGAYFSTPEMSVGKLKAVFTLYRPKPKGKFVFSAILSDISLGALNLDAGPLDQVGMQSVVVVYAPDALGKTNVSRWPGKLGGALKGLTPSARNTNLTINKSLNVRASRRRKPFAVPRSCTGARGKTPSSSRALRSAMSPSFWRRTPAGTKRSKPGAISR